jgi:Trypsin
MNRVNRTVSTASLLLVGVLLVSAAQATRGLVPAAADECAHPLPPQVAGGLPVGGGGARGQPSNPLLRDPTWVENQAKVIRLRRAENPSRSVGSDEVNEFDPEPFSDCVCVLRKSNPPQVLASGTLIGPNVVLTCGHGADPHQGPNGGFDRVFIGANVVARPNDGRFVKVKKRIPHPNFSQHRNEPGTDPVNKLGWTDNNNDVAILILEEYVPDVPPRRVASSEQVQLACFIRVVGFGANEADEFDFPIGHGVKRQVPVPIATCDCGRTTPNDRVQYGCIVGQEIVASAKYNKVADSCQGDSGGPAYVQVGDQHFLAGVVSRAIRPSEDTTKFCGQGGIYVRVDKYWDWIRSAAAAPENGGVIPP